MASDSLSQCHGAQSKKENQDYQGQLKEIGGLTPNYFKATGSLWPSLQVRAPWQSLKPSQSIKLSLGCLAVYTTCMHGTVLSCHCFPAPESGKLRACHIHQGLYDAIWRLTRLLTSSQQAQRLYNALKGTEGSVKALNPPLKGL